MKTTRSILLLSCLSLQAAWSAWGQYAVNWSVTAGGGGVSSGGTYAVRGTVGQPAANRSSGGGFGLASGFWAVTEPGAFTPGNLLVEGLGDGTGLGNAQPVWIEELTTNGVLAQAKNLPNTYPRPSASPFNILDLGNDPSEGYLTRSTAGQLVCISGYNATNHEAGIDGSSSATAARVVGVMTADGTVDTSRAVAMFSGRNFHSVTTMDGTNFWAVGEGGVAGPCGLVYFQPGVATNSLINDTFQCVRIFNHQLYVSTPVVGQGKGGVYAVGSGLPTNGAPKHTQIISLGGSVSNPYEFEFSPAMTVAYIADGRGTGGGIIKYTNSGAAWSYDYTLVIPPLGNPGARGLAVDWSGANPAIYAITAELQSRLVRIVDTNASATAVTLRTAPAFKAFRGITWVPVRLVAPTIVSERILAGGDFELTFTGTLSQTYRVLASPDVTLPASNWTVLTSGMFGAGSVTLTDEGASGHPTSFYRIASP